LYVWVALFAVFVGASLRAAGGMAGQVGSGLLWCGMGALLLAPLICLMYLMLFRLQASLLEFLIIVSAAANVLGLTLRSAASGDSGSRSGSAFMTGALAMVLVYMLLGGAVWGLSAARRLGERRAWPRLRLIGLGMGIYPAGAMAIAGPFLIVEGLTAYGPLSLPWFMASCALFASALLWTVAFIRTENRCRARGGEEVIF